MDILSCSGLIVLALVLLTLYLAFLARVLTKIILNEVSLFVIGFSKGIIEALEKQQAQAQTNKRKQASENTEPVH